MEKQKLKNQLKIEFQDIITERTDMLAWYARQLLKIFEDDPELKVSASVNTSLLTKALIKLDDEFVAKEVVFYREYLQLIKRSKKLLLVEQKEALDIAIATLKNRLNLAIVFVSDEATEKLPQARELEVSDVVIARLEYLSELTLEKQIRIFDSLMREGFK